MNLNIQLCNFYHYENTMIELTRKRSANNFNQDQKNISISSTMFFSNSTSHGIVYTGNLTNTSISISDCEFRGTISPFKSKAVDQNNDLDTDFDIADTQVSKIH